MKIAVIGTGGVGGYLGGKMALAGYQVTFVARGEHLKIIRQNGLTVKSINGNFVVNPAQVTDAIGDVGDATFIILGVKAWQVTEVASILQGKINPASTILPLQNGVMAYEELSAVLGKSYAIGGLCRIMSRIESPGVISHEGIEPVVLFGEMTNVKTERVLLLQDIFIKSGIKAAVAEDIQAELWKKFINICVSGLLAITRSTYGEIRTLRETRDLMIELFEEIYLLSQKMGIHIDHEFVANTVAFVDTYPFNSTSSLTRDVWEGKPSEIEYQNGTVVRLAEKLGIDTPVNRFIYNCILPMEKKARRTDTIN
jgi:2-dehydropantoate 2-reductase